MPSIALLPALALLGGALCGVQVDLHWLALKRTLLPLVAAGWIGWRFGWRLATVAAATAGFFCAGAVVAADARHEALHTPLRALLDEAFGGFSIDDIGPAGRHDPVRVRAVLAEDAARQTAFVTLRAAVTSVRLSGRWHDAAGGVTIGVGGRVSPEQADEWRAGRDIETIATFRRPARYLDEGVPDFEREVALDGTTLFGSVKSGLLVDVLGRAGALDEAAGTIRTHVRQAVQRWVGRHDPVSAAIVTAVLIGDRTGLPDEIRLRLQAAGTYHVIAISGGNIAILAGLTLVLLLVCGVTGRPAALVTSLTLAAYAQVVTAGASVWRATLMAVLYLSARLLDHRSPPWQAMAAAAACAVCVRPLDVRDAGFVLTFGATAALIEGGGRAAALTGRHPIVRWAIASAAASLAVEIALLPVSAWTFSRVTSAGLLLNLVAVPLMGVVQVAGMGAVLLDGVDVLARPAGWLAHVAAAGLVGSARLVDVLPWLTARVPPPPLAVVILYYAGLAAALITRGWLKVCAATLVLLAAVSIAAGWRAEGLWPASDPAALLRLVVFDVGQGDASLLELPDGTRMLVDAGGVPFGGGTFDIGARVLAPALWARGIQSLDTLLLTHADPDHMGGARAIVHDFSPTRFWYGVPVPRHEGLQDLLQAAKEGGADVEERRAGDELRIGGARVRILHPPVPDWERQRVRNDDSVVLEVRYGDVAMLLAGDVGGEVERTLVPHLTPARIRILKVSHHGSRTSSSSVLLDGWRPQIAIVSAGRGNTFGHPAPEVLRRLESIGAAIYRTDLNGQVTVEVDGRRAVVNTFASRSRP